MMKYLITLFWVATAIISLRAQDAKPDSTLYLEVHFKLDSDVLDRRQKSLIDSVMEVAPVNVLKTIRVFGHTDSLAGVDYNRQLSKRRVQSILAYLVYQGVDPLKMKADYFGEERPKYDNSPGERYKNRRCEIEFVIDPSLLPAPEMRLQDLPFAKGDRVRIPNLNFVGNQPIPVPESYPVLEDLLYAMKKYPDLQIELQGHVCCSDNFELSQERARMVYDFLKANGVEGSRMSYRGFSNSKPLFKERTERDKALNRRVEILVVDNSGRSVEVEQRKGKIDLRAPVLGVKFMSNKSRLQPAGHFALTLIAEMMREPSDLKYEFVVFDNINNSRLSQSRAKSIERTLLSMKVDRHSFNVRQFPPTASMPVKQDENFVMLMIKK